jgi:4-hydroxybenzoate polyprenyltransferase
MAVISVLLFFRLIQGDTYPITGVFWLYVVGVFLSMSAGYLINDYYDIQTDSVNRPNSKKLSRKGNYVGFVALAGIVLCIASLLVFYYGEWIFGWVLMVSILLLWAYSYGIQRIAILGNLTIVLLTILLYLPFCMPAHILCNEPTALGFLILSALITFARELIKDAEDREGDSMSGYKTLPILVSAGIIKRLSEGIVLLALIVLFVMFSWWMHPGAIQLVSIPVYAILVNFVYTSWQTSNLQSNALFFKRQSRRLKWSMVFFMVYVFWQL